MKRKKIFAILFFVVMSFFMPKKASSQLIEVGMSGGMSYYIGDINPSKHFAQGNLALGGVLRYYNNSRWAFRMQYSNFTLGASDKKIGYRPERDLAFSSTVNDVALLAEFNFFDYWTGSSRSYVTPYIFAGVSVFNFKTKAPDGTELQPLATEGVNYSNLSWSVPFGLGVKYSISEHLGATLEWRMYKSFTDYIDDIHGLYPENPAVIGDYNYTDPTGNFEAGMQRGNGDDKMFGYNNDWYGTIELSLVFKFNVPDKTPCYSGIR